MKKMSWGLLCAFLLSGCALHENAENVSMIKPESYQESHRETVELEEKKTQDHDPYVTDRLHDGAVFILDPAAVGDDRQEHSHEHESVTAYNFHIQVFLYYAVMRLHRAFFQKYLCEGRDRR